MGISKADLYRKKRVFLPWIFTVAYQLQVEHSAVNRVVVGSSPTRGVV